MKQKIHLIMPMGGAGSRFFKNGFVSPKPLIEINGKPFLYWATESIRKYVDLVDITFVVLREHIDNFEIDSVIKAYYPNAKITVIPKLLNGAVLTCMHGVNDINDSLPILFNDCDHAFYSKSFNDFANSGNFDTPDGALLTFTSNDPKFSFLVKDKEGNICGTVEKVAVSNSAICGAYYFKSKEVFLDNAKTYLEKCSYSEYFVSGVYNIMTESGLRVSDFTCDIHTPFGTPEEYYAAENNEIFKRLR